MYLVALVPQQLAQVGAVLAGYAVMGNFGVGYAQAAQWVGVQSRVQSQLHLLHCLTGLIISMPGLDLNLDLVNLLVQQLQMLQQAVDELLEQPRQLVGRILDQVWNSRGYKANSLGYDQPVLRQQAADLVRLRSTRLCGRMDKPRANTATAHKLARMVYFMLTRGETFVDQGQQRCEEQQRQRSIAALIRRAAAMGFQLHPTTTP